MLDRAGVMAFSPALDIDSQTQARMTRKLIHAAGGLEAAAAVTTRGKTQLGRYQSPNEPDSITLEVIEALESVTHRTAGHPVITRYLANRAGYVLVKLPEAQPEPADLMKYIGSMSKELGDVSKHILDDLADGKLDDAQGAIEELFDLIRVAVAMIEALKAFQER